jgi:hypothetical protein
MYWASGLMTTANWAVFMRRCVERFVNYMYLGFSAHDNDIFGSVTCLCRRGSRTCTIGGVSME